MNHLRAAQKQGDGLWHYTLTNKRVGTHPIGYCAEGCPGHATAEDAREHYREYLLDKRLQFHDGPDNPKTVSRCEAPGCEEYTAGSAQIGGHEHHRLCAKHRNRETVDGLLTVYESWES